MKRSYHTLFPLLITALLAIASFWLSYVVQNAGVFADIAKTRHDPDIIVSDFDVLQFNKDGFLQMQLTAQQMRHFPDNDTVEIDAPQISFNDPNRSMVWTSERAFGDNNHRTITLQGNVQGHSPATATTPPRSIATEKLTLLTNDEIATTDLPITFSQPGSVVHATAGGQWDNINGLLTLNKVQADLQQDSFKRNAK